MSEKAAGRAAGGRAAAERAGWRLRPMRAEDLDAVAAIEAASFSLPWPRESFRRELEEIPNSHLPLVEGPAPGVLGRGGERAVLAYACWWEVVDECHITNFAVAPETRRRGVADFLLEGMLAGARARGAVRATLEVRAGNAPAIALYEKWGFTAAAMRPRYYPDTGEDALVMWKQAL